MAVKDLRASAEWYNRVLGFKSEGIHFVVLRDEDGQIVLCLHPWKMDGHPSMMDPEITPGNGIILYFKTNRYKEIYQNVRGMGFEIEEELHKNLRSGKMEFSLRDPDGYFIIITEYHEYEG